MKSCTALLCWIPFLFLAGNASSQSNPDSIYLKIRIFSEYPLHQAIFTPLSGDYDICHRTEKISSLAENTPLILLVNEKKVRIKKPAGSLGSYDTVYLRKEGAKGQFHLRAGKKERIYDGELIGFVSGQHLVLINRVSLEAYTSGVVQAEAGNGHDPEFYKIQSLISRTYALRNIRKHETEAYQLCDQVHCQLYKGRNLQQEILDAVDATRGQVILGPDTQLISAAFHSNSGGETCNSEDVWSLPSVYLKAVTDSFSLDMPGARWEKTISKNRWLHHLKERYNFPLQDSARLDSALNFRQLHRRPIYVNNIPLKELRNDFKLRSTFFDVVDQGEEILLKGKGYGHGVGLSQEGAIRMTRLGYHYEDILRFYYRQIRIDKIDTSLIPKRPLSVPPQPGH